MSHSPRWLDVDPAGLAKIVERKGPAFILFELLQNAWDEDGVTSVAVRLDPVPGRPLATLSIHDDAPEGWKRLSDAWTLFAESYKKGDPTRRGAFNLGEKLVLVRCVKATILTTTGGVHFDAEGRTVIPAHREKTERGSHFLATIRLTREELAEVLDAAKRVLPPPGVRTVINGEMITAPAPIATVEATLSTVVGDEDGILRPRERKTTILVHEAPGGEGWLYEMGLPVVPTGDRFHYDVQQKVPVNLDRDNVPPAYLRRLRAAALNALHDRIGAYDASEAWVREAAASPECSPAAFDSALAARFGEKRVMADPSDREAGHRAVAKGYTLVHGTQLSEGERKNLRALRDAGNDPLPAAGRVFPTPRPYSADGPAVTLLPESDWTVGIRRVVAYSRSVGRRILGFEVKVRVVSDMRAPFLAAYGTRTLDLNLQRLGHPFFDAEGPDGLHRVHALLLHEFAHEREGNHLDHKYHDAICELGAALARDLLAGRVVPANFGYFDAEEA